MFLHMDNVSIFHALTCKRLHTLSIRSFALVSFQIEEKDISNTHRLRFFSVVRFRFREFSDRRVLGLPGLFTTIHAIYFANFVNKMVLSLQLLLWLVVRCGISLENMCVYLTVDITKRHQQSDKILNGRNT